MRLRRGVPQYISQIILLSAKISVRNNWDDYMKIISYKKIEKQFNKKYYCIINNAKCISKY